MNVSAALESFDTVRCHGPKSTKYEARIARCVELAGRVFQDLIDSEIHDWVLSVVEARHDLAHHREGFRTVGSVGDHLLAEQLYWLFSMCMLRVAGAPEGAFEAIGRHAQVRWLREQARAAAAETRGA